MSDAPLYPLEPFADFLVQLVKLRGDEEGLIALATRVDDMLAIRVGSAAAGQKALERAVSLLEREETGTAIRELHKAKAKWFSGERLPGTLRVILLLSEQYKMVGLAYAAKYHAMAAAFIARYAEREDIQEFQPEALLDLIDAEDAAGNSFGFLQLLPVYLDIHVRHDNNPLNVEQHPRLASNIGHLAALLGFLKRGNPSSRAAIDDVAAAWPSVIKDPIWEAAASPDGFWQKGTWLELWTGFENEALDRPFGDLGPERRVHWKAGGITWTCVFSNDYRTTPPAEQLVAELQIVSCALAGKDLGLVPTEIVLELIVEESRRALTVEEPTTKNQRFRALLPLAGRGPEQASDVILVYATVMRACSVLDDERLMAPFDHSVLEPIFVGRPYAELYREFVPENLFAESTRLAAPPLDPERHFESKAGSRVQWFDGLGPSFEETRAMDDAKNRYDRVIPSIRYTVASISQDVFVRPRLLTMHNSGKKDWEILSIISNIAIGKRQPLTVYAPIEELKARYFALIDKVETPESALTPDVFTDEQFETHSHVYLGAFLASWQLTWPPCSTAKGMEDFLIARFRLRDIDVPHCDIFGWSVERTE